MVWWRQRERSHYDKRADCCCCCGWSSQRGPRPRDFHSYSCRNPRWQKQLPQRRWLSMVCALSVCGSQFSALWELCKRPANLDGKRFRVCKRKLLSIRNDCAYFSRPFVCCGNNREQQKKHRPYFYTTITTHRSYSEHECELKRFPAIIQKK